MHVLATYYEGQYPYAEILPTTKNAFDEAFNLANTIKQQLTDHELDSEPLEEIENFLLTAKKDSSIYRDDDGNSPWSIGVTINKDGHLSMTSYSQINKNDNFEFTIRYQNIEKD